MLGCGAPDLIKTLDSVPRFRALPAASVILTDDTHIFFLRLFMRSGGQACGNGELCLLEPPGEQPGYIQANTTEKEIGRLFITEP